nr:hypothetical protein [Mycobacteroides abscessus]
MIEMNIADLLREALTELEANGWQPSGLGSYNGPKCAIGAVLKVTGDWKPEQTSACWAHGTPADHAIQLIEAHMFEVEALDDAHTLNDLAAWNQVAGRKFTDIAAAFYGAIQEADDSAAYQ